MKCLKEADKQCFHCKLPDCVPESKKCLRSKFLNDKKEFKNEIKNKKMTTIMQKLPKNINT